MWCWSVVLQFDWKHLLACAWLSNGVPVCRRSPASVWTCSHRGPAALHPPPSTRLPQEVAAAHEDGVTHQPECRHASPPPCYRHPDIGKELANIFCSCLILWTFPKEVWAQTCMSCSFIMMSLFVYLLFTCVSGCLLWISDGSHIFRLCPGQCWRVWFGWAVSNQAGVIFNGSSAKHPLSPRVPAWCHQWPYTVPTNITGIPSNCKPQPTNS